MAIPFGLPPVRVGGPTLWCAAAVGTIYLGCAAYEVHHDANIARQVKRQRAFGNSSPITMHEIDGVRAMITAAAGRNPLHPPPAQMSSKSSASIVRDAWSDISEAGKLMVGIVSMNMGVFAMERSLPGTSTFFSHLPAATGNNFTLLTSAFGHVGLTHLALNMYGLVQFVPPVAYSPTFLGSGCHLAAFYLSSGILSAYAFHLASIWPRPLDRMIPARGASGAVMAIIGAFGMSYPNHGLGIILVPASLPASQFLTVLALFETYGLFIGFKRLPLAHAAHLSGLAIGCAYVHFNGKAHVWDPAKRWAFKRLRLMNIE